MSGDYALDSIIESTLLYNMLRMKCQYHAVFY